MGFAGIMNTNRSRLAFLMSAALVTMLLAATPASANCWVGGDAEVSRLQRMVDTNPGRALSEIERQIADAREKGARNQARLGWLLGAKSAAATYLSDFKAAEASAEEGLKLSRSIDNKPIEIENLIRRILISEPSLSKERIDESLNRLENLRSAYSPVQREHVCASIAMAVLHITLGDKESALKIAGDAYRNAKRSRLSEPGAFASLILSSIVLATGDMGEGEALAREYENWGHRMGYQTAVITGLYLRGQIALLSERYDAAAKAFRQVATLSPRIGIPSADGAMGACESYVKLSRPNEALPFCRLAARAITKIQFGPWYRANLNLADALLQNSESDEAKKILETLILIQVPGQIAAWHDRAIELRARAHFLDGEFEAAYLLQLQAGKNAAARQKVSREEEIAKLRAQFAWDRQRIANAELERDLAKTAAQARVRQTWLMTAIGWTVLLVAMLIWIVYSSRRHRRRLEALANEAREIARSKADLLSTMSHEIRSPLGSLTLAASNLANSSEIPSTSKDKALRVSVAAERLLRQLEDLLLFSRLDAKQLPLAVQSFEPQSLVERAASLLTDQAGAVGIVIDVIIQEGTPIIVEGDSGRVSQIVSNLLENAIKHSGGSLIEVRLGSESADRYYIEVSDNGQGMTAESRERAMQKFVQVGKPSSSGFGLGLSICKGLTDLMGGELSLSPSESGGLTVRLDLPVTATESFTSRAEPSMRQTQPA